MVVQGFSQITCLPASNAIFAKGPREGELTGRKGERGLLVSAARPTPPVSEGGGCWFGLGQTGVYSFGDGYYAYSAPLVRPEEGRHMQASEVGLYRLDREAEKAFVEV